MPGGVDDSEQVTSLFGEMMRRDPSERERFLEERCGGDHVLYGELLQMLKWETHMSGFLTDPLINHIDFNGWEKVFVPGAVSDDGRFEILKMLGAGGMGVVYQAHDRARNLRIAIKIPKSEFKSLLSPELEGALKVRHANICLVNDRHAISIEGHSVDALTMEYLEGQVLSSYIREHGRLESSQALDIARQLCAGISEAHRSGVLHRDLKSANVMLTAAKTTGWRVVIMDFGLASEDHIESQIQGGTPDYMAPELFAGARATRQSDIYALGVILYELITGTAPFESSESHSQAKPQQSILIKQPLTNSSAARSATDLSDRNLRRELIAPGKRVPGIPKRCSRTILRCLDADPAQRFADADSVLAALEGEPLPLTYYARSLTRSVRRSRKLQAAIFLPICFLLMAVSYQIYRYYIQMPEIPPGTQVLVANSVTSEPELSGITVALKSQLEQSARFEVVGDEKVAQVLKEMKISGNTTGHRVMREVALRCGAVLVIFSMLTRTSQDYVLAMNVERAKSNPWLPAATWSRNFHARDEKELLARVHDAAVWVRQVAGERTADVAKQDRPVEDTTTSSWLALQLLQQANEKYASGDAAAALLLLDEALQADPQFAMAHMRKADILIAQKRYTEGYPEWQTAIEITDKTELTSRENLRIKGLYYEDIGDYRAAEKAFHEYTVHFPNDPAGWIYWGSALDDLNRKWEAVDSFRKAVALQPDSISGNFHLAQLCLVLGDTQEADKAIQSLSASQAPEWGIWLKAYSFLDVGQVSTALEQATQLEKSSKPEWQSRGYLVHANLLSELGQKQQAIAVLEQAVEFDKTRNVRDGHSEKLLALGYLLQISGDPSRSGDFAKQAADFDQSPATLAAAGILLARSGDRESARRLLAAVKSGPDIPRVRLVTNILEGELYQSEGNLHLALSHFLVANELARPAETKDWLANALITAGNAPKAQSLVDQIFATPTVVLYQLQRRPGFWADSFSRFAGDQDTWSETTCVAARRFMRLRGANDTNKFTPEVIKLQERYRASCPIN